MSYNTITPDDVLRTINDARVFSIHLRFTDLGGQWRKYSAPPSAIDRKSFESGIGFTIGLEGSAIRRSRDTEASDILAIPDPASAFLDPFVEPATLTLICNMRDPVTSQNIARDPRYIAQKAETYLKTTELGDTAKFGLRVEGAVINTLSTASSINSRNCQVDDRGHSEVPSIKVLQIVRAGIIETLQNIGIEADVQQDAIELRISTLTRMADIVMIYGYVAENVARKHGATATFARRPPFGGDNSGVSVYQSIWHDERPLFAGDGYARSSALMRHYFAGLLKHKQTLLAIDTPGADLVRTTMSSIAALSDARYSRRPSNPAGMRVEFPCQNLPRNPYLTFAAMLMAGIDGFHNRWYNLDPGEPIKNFQLPAEILSSSELLDDGHAFLTKGEVFTSHIIKDLLR